MKSAAICLSFLIVGHPLAARAQATNKILERYVAAIGGKKAIERIVSTQVTGTVTTADGRTGVFVERSKRPRLYAVSLTWGDARWRAGFNGRAAWEDDGAGGARTLYGKAASRVRAEAIRASSRHAGPDVRFAAEGQSDVRGRPALVVAEFAPDGTRRTLHFDAASGLLVKDEQQVGASPGEKDERFFDDYRRDGQVMEPHRIEWRRNGETFTIAVERVTHNTPLDDRAFDVPEAPPSGPPLEIAAVLSAAELAEQRADGMRTAYAFTQTGTLGKIDEQGRLTEDEGPTWEYFHVGGRPIARMVKQRGGKALTEGERRREDERVTALVRYLRGQGGRPDPRGTSSPSSGPRFVIVLSPQVTANWLPSLRRMSEFSHIRRERVRERPAVVIEFQSRRSASATNDWDRQAGAMSGVVWIDEASQQAIRLESSFHADHDRIQPGSAVRVEHVLVNGEVWLPSESETNVLLGFTFGKRSHFLFTSRYADYKKFSVATESTIALPER